MKRVVCYVAAGLAVLSSGLAVEPEDKAKANADYQAGLKEYRTKNLKEAEELTERALSLDPDNSAALVLKGAIQVERRDFKVSRVTFEAAGRLDPGNPQIGFNVAEIDYVEHRWPEAEKAFTALLPAPGQTDEIKRLMRFKLMVAALKQGKRKDFDTQLAEFEKENLQKEIDFSRLLLELDDSRHSYEKFKELHRMLAKKHGDVSVYADSLMEAYYQEKL